jgi:hypothetical protein
MTETPGTPGTGSGNTPDPAFAPPPPPVYPPASYPPAAEPAAPTYPPAADQAAAYPPAAPTSHSAQFGFDSKNLQGFDPKTVDSLDWGIIAAGLLAMLFSFFGYYKYTVKIDGFGSSSATFSAWHGFFGWFGALVAFAAAAVLAANLIAKISLPFPVRLAVLGGFALALLCAILALFVVPGNTSGVNGLGVHLDKGHGFSYWISLVVLLAGTGLAFVRFTATGGKLPSRG